MIYLFFYIAITVLSQVLLKQASLKNLELKTSSYLLQMFKTPKVLVAYGLSGINIIIWIITLSKTSLLIAFFISSFSYVVMVFLDHYIFNEKINYVKILATLFITLGVILNILQK